MHITGLEQMGYKGTKKRMHCYRRLPEKDVPLMESEKIKGGDPFSPATHIFNEASNPAPSRRHHDVTEFITMSNVSEEGVAKEKEEISFSQDLALLVVMEEQIWGRLSNPIERPEKGQSDPENCAGLSEKEIALNIQETNLEDIRDLPLNCHQGALTAAYSLSSHQPSVFNTTTLIQTLSTPSQVQGEQVVGFSQALNPYDTFPQTQCGETVRTDTFPAYECPSVTHGITKRHQNAESSKARSDDHSQELEAHHEMDKELLEGTWGTDEEMASKTEGSGSIQSNSSTKDDGEKVGELKEQREDVKSFAPFQSSSECSEERRINVYVTQAKPDGILSLLPSKTGKDQSGMDEEVVEMGQNSFIYTVLHLKEEEQDDTGESKTHVLKETNQSKHAKNNTDCDEADQKELSKTMEQEMEALELADTEQNEGKEDLDQKGMENKIKTKHEKLELEHTVREEQESDILVAKAGRKGGEREPTTPPVTLETLYNLENNLNFPNLNKNSSFAETEGFAFSFKELFSPDHCPKSICEFPAMAFARSPEGLHLMNESPRTECPISHDSRQLEYSDIFDPESCISNIGQDSEQTTEEDGKHSIEKKGSENAGAEKSVRSVAGEGISPSCRDFVVTLDPQDLHDSQTAVLPVDSEIDRPASLLGTIIAASPLQEDAGQEACEKGSTSDSDVDVQAPRKNITFNKDFHEDAPGSASRILQSESSGEGLPNTAKENAELSLASSLTKWDPASLQTQDITINYLEKFQQHLSPPIRSFVFPEKEAEEGTLCMEQQTSVNESPCFSVLKEEDRTECDHNTGSPASPNICFVIATDVAQLIKPLTPMPFSNQTLAPEPASSPFIQPQSLTPDSRPTQSLTPPPKAHIPAQPTVHGLDPRHPSELLEQPPSSNQCLAQKSTSIKAPLSSVPTLDAKLFDHTPAFECDLSQHSQLPDPLPSSDQFLSLEYDANQPVSIPHVFSHTVFPEFNISQSSQLVSYSQARESTAPGLNDSLPTQLPVFAINKELHNPTPASRSNLPPTPDGKHLTKQSVESPASNLPTYCTSGDDWIHNSVPIVNVVSETTPCVLESENLAQIPNMDNRVEEVSVVELAKSGEAGVPQGQKDWDIHEICSGLEVNTLGRHSDLVIFRNEASVVNPVYNIPETMSNAMYTHNGKTSSDNASYPSVKSQKMCKVTESANSTQSPPLLAFTNPIHFLQLGPPSPPTIRHPYEAVSQGPQWQQQQQTGNAKDTTASVVMWQVAEGSETFRKGLKKSVMEPVPAAVVPRKDRLGKHPPLEKSSSCPIKNVIGLDTKESASNSKKQDVSIRHRAKSKDWHRHGVRKVSIPTDSALEVGSPLVPSKETTPVNKDKSDHLDRVKYGEKKPAEALENITRRRSKLINSSRLLYQEYSDVALNKAIQNQKRADSLSEDVDVGPLVSPRLRRKVLSPQDSYLQRLSVSSSTSLWQDIPMVRGSTMLLSMTREEQKLQEAKFELIASEASYLRSLNVAVDHFQHSQELHAVLTNQDKQWLFSRLQDVRDVSANFLFDLEEKLEENMFTFNVCDVALRHAPEFRRVYLPYVTNQTYQEQTFRRLLNGVPAFQQVLERLESDPVCQRLSLKSFLILPFQRITRLKLLLQNILKRTQPGADEEVQATQAYDALEKLIKDCSENVQRMKSTEELIYLSQNMEFECKIFPLISQSRRLVKRGELTALEYNLNSKWKLTTRPIYLHLFNDYLLLSRPRENGRFIVFDYAASSDVRGEKCEMKLHGANKNVFRLFLLQNNQGKKVEFLFRTETQSEKLRWISALMPQQAEPDLLNDSDAPQVQCVRSYKARENDELALEKADIIMVLQQCSDGWIEGVKLSDGERGWLPSDQVEFISSKQARQMNLKEEQRVKNAKQQVFRRK